jgi:tRNA (guanine-N7-)-methyltransferase
VRLRPLAIFRVAGEGRCIVHPSFSNLEKMAGGCYFQGMARVHETESATQKLHPADGLQRLWGRRQSFALRTRQKALFEALLPKVAIALPADVLPGSLAPLSFFPSPLVREGGAAQAAPGEGPLPSRISLEIGFGGGEHLIAWAKRHLDEGFIGAEPFVNGMGKMLAHLDDEKLDNVRLFAGDARRLVAALRPASLARAWLLFPDPWPKKRHWKRRYVQDEALKELARVIEPGGVLRIASDIPHYIEWTLEHMAKRPEFTAVHPANGFVERPADWPQTRYEQKALRENRTPVYLEFRRV